MKNSKLEETKEQLELGISNHTQAWKFVFQCLGLKPNSKNVINNKDLERPDSKITKAILFMYSMESFLPYSLNKAVREKDASKVMSLGPFACLLYDISFFA